VLAVLSAGLNVSLHNSRLLSSTNRL